MRFSFLLIFLFAFSFRNPIFTSIAKFLIAEVFLFYPKSKMTPAERDQILTIIKNLEEKSTTVPYFSDLVKHPVFGPIFSGLSKDKQKEINQILHDYIIEKIAGLGKTKGGQLFQRFFEAQESLFWEFRALNEKTTTDTKAFQEKGAIVEQEMFRLEGILTEKMVGQEKGLDKVVGSFYTIVYSLFPRMNEIE